MRELLPEILGIIFVVGSMTIFAIGVSIFVIYLLEPKTKYAPRKKQLTSEERYAQAARDDHIFEEVDRFYGAPW